MSEEFVDLAHLEKEPLETILLVSTPAHKLLMATHRDKGDSVTVSGRVNRSCVNSIKHARL